MKRIFATLLLVFPVAALSVLPNSASAEPANRDANYDRQPMTRQQDNRSYNKGHEPHDGQRVQSRRHRKWVAAHYEKANHRRRWVPGHYE
jgi:hypothetical protein